MSKANFLISPETGLVKDSGTEDFQFSDYLQDESESNDASAESDDSEETFEDSKEAFSDRDTPVSVVNAEFLTPVNLKSSFARTLHLQEAKSSARPTSTSTPSSGKRPAKSPAELKKNKKSRAQSLSKIPKKK